MDPFDSQKVRSGLGKKVITIQGPTASGKTGIGVKLAKEFNGEIVSADSRQVYRGLDLGTGKDLAEYDGVKYHLINIADPGEKMTLFDYLPLARVAIDDILSRGKLPVVVGGTGLYVQGIVEGFTLSQKKNSSNRSLDSARDDSQLSISSQTTNTKSQISKYSREQLDNKTVEQLNNTLEKLDPEKHKTVDRKNRHRLIRAIELAQEGLEPTKVKPDFEALQIAVDLPRQELFERIDRRVDERFEAGMLEEVISLLRSGASAKWLMNLGLEYKLITDFILVSGIRYNVSGNKSHNTLYKIRNTNEFAAMKQDLKYKIHQFARRQLTWLRRFPEINWLSNFEEIERFARIFLSH